MAKSPSNKKPNVQPPAADQPQADQPQSDSQPPTPPEPPADPEKPKARDGMVLMRAADGCGGFGFDGQSYPVINGMVELPQQAVEAAKDHGFTEVEQ